MIYIEKKEPTKLMPRKGVKANVGLWPCEGKREETFTYRPL